MEMMIRQGKTEDVDALTELYGSVCDYLERTTNYPGWKKDIYPAREDAVSGVEEGCLYVAEISGKIAGTIILRHKPEEAYLNAEWKLPLNYEKVLVVYTFAVHPDYTGQGVGKGLLDFAAEHGRKSGVRSMRLDVGEKNLPAIRLYEKCGFEYIGTVDLGLGEIGLKWFRLYEKLI